MNSFRISVRWRSAATLFDIPEASRATRLVTGLKLACPWRSRQGAALHHELLREERARQPASPLQFKIAEIGEGRRSFDWAARRIAPGRARIAGKHRFAERAALGCRLDLYFRHMIVFLGKLCWIDRAVSLDGIYLVFRHPTCAPRSRIQSPQRPSQALRNLRSRQSQTDAGRARAAPKLLQARERLPRSLSASPTISAVGSALTMR